MSRLILFAGSSPGAGKTTLSGVVAEQMAAHGIAALWLSEEEVEAELARHESIWQDGDLALEPFLRAGAAFATSYRDAGEQIIVDSWLPPVYLLAGRYPATVIEQFALQLYESLRPLDPLLIYLRCDVATALSRAVEQRGGQWIENVRAFMNGWRVPHFSGDARPFPTKREMICFFESVDQITLRIVERWPGETLVLDSTSTPLDQLAATLLTRFGLEYKPLDHHVPLRLLESYAGAYVACDQSADPQRLIIRLDGARLIADAYWPGGTILILSDDSGFRLEATNRFIIFDAPRDGDSPGLTYVVRGAVSRYRRAA